MYPYSVYRAGTSVRAVSVVLSAALFGYVALETGLVACVKSSEAIGYEHQHSEVGRCTGKKKSDIGYVLAGSALWSTPFAGQQTEQWAATSDQREHYRSRPPDGSLLAECLFS